jgi:RhtB (resistance to homoserine/threonine) family protein
MDLSLLAFVCFVAMVSPGPDFVIVTRSALCYGRPQALATALGVVSGCIVHATFCVVGLAILISKSVLIFSSIKYAGACYLIYLGIQGLRSPRQGTARSSELKRAESNQPSIARAYVDGLLCNLLNPKLVLFLLSLFTQFISPDASAFSKAIVAAVFVAEACIYWPLLSLVLQKECIRNIFNSTKLWLDRVCGVLLCALGLRVAFARE